MSYNPASGGTPGPNSVTNAMLVNVATARFKGRVTAGTGATEDLTGTQATTLLDTFTSGLKGLAPASGGGTTNFLRADGTWTAPAGGSGYTYATTAVGYTETATSGEKIVTVTASGQTVVLPNAVGNTAKLTFKLTVAGTLTLDGNGSQTIDGGLTAVLQSQYEAVTIISDNANWQVI